jgi:hypothetical protein
MNAPIIWKEKSELKVKKAKILLMVQQKLSNGTDSDEILEILQQNHLVKDLKYNYIDDRGFCVCSNLVYYYNNCQEEKDTSVLYGILTFAVFVMIFIITKCVLICKKIRKRPQDSQNSYRLNSGVNRNRVNHIRNAWA